MNKPEDPVFYIGRNRAGAKKKQYHVASCVLLKRARNGGRPKALTHLRLAGVEPHSCVTEIDAPEGQEEPR